MFKSSLKEFKEKFDLSDKERKFLINHEKNLEEKAIIERKEFMDNKMRNNIITLDDLAIIISEQDKDIQCNEEELEESLKELKQIRDIEKMEKQLLYRGFKQDQKVIQKKIDNGNTILLYFTGNKSFLNDKIKECRFKDTRHIIYPLEDYSFHLSKTKNISFKFEVLTYSVWIAIGICDLKQINKNGKVFYRPRNNEYPHGTFVLGSVRKFQDGYKVTKFHHWGNAYGSYELQNDFPYFLPGRIINVFYESETRRIIYTSGVCEVIIDNCTSVNGEDDVLAPCIVFMYDEDKIKLFDFKKVNK